MCVYAKMTGGQYALILQNTKTISASSSAGITADWKPTELFEYYLVFYDISKLKILEELAQLG